jgi:hypothetical protein
MSYATPDPDFDWEKFKQRDHAIIEGMCPNGCGELHELHGGEWSCPDCRFTYINLRRVRERRRIQRNIAIACFTLIVIFLVILALWNP